MKRHLIVTLNNKGFGESILGVNLAMELQQAGDQVLFLTHDSNSKLLGAGLPYVSVCDAAAPLFKVYLDDCLNRFRPSSIILSDYSASANFLKGLGWTLDMFTSTGIPVFAIDTWGRFRIPENDAQLGDRDDAHEQFRRRGDAEDKEAWRLASPTHGRNVNWCSTVKPLCPVPFLSRGASPGSYCSLPAAVSKSKSRQLRSCDTLGLSSESRMVLLCTSPWQHVAEWQTPTIARDGMLEDAQTGAKKNNNCSSANDWARLGAQWDGARRLAASLPTLVAHYLSRLGDSVHLVHVGPRSFELAGQLKGRYHWLPSLTPGEFDAVLARANLFLSANITGTTVAKALTRGKPVMVLHNSVSASTVAEAETQAGAELSSALRQWLEQAVPLSPFTLWPLGYTRFLEPILQGNSYTAALECVEILQERKVEASLASLLFDAVAREDQIHRQDSYVREVGALPRAADLVIAGLEA